jgi:hypothetical protein
MSSQPMRFEQRPLPVAGTAVTVGNDPEFQPGAAG